MRFLFISLIIGAVYTVKSQSDTLLLVGKTVIQFESNSSEIRSDQTTKLDSILSKTNDVNVLSFQISAHTDLVGSEAYNKRLSEKRASSARAYLLSKGVSPSRIAVSYFGEQRPVSYTINEQDNQLNRRAEINILSPKSSVWITGRTIDKDSKQGIQSMVKMHSKFWKDSIQTNEKGHFKILVPQGEVIGLDIIAPNYILDMQMLKISNTKDQKAHIIELSKVTIGSKFDLNRLFFVGDKDLLLPGSFNILPLLYEFMESNSNTCISIHGHINLPNTNKTQINTHYHDLSIARARRVYNYLLSRGINADRMIYKGFGNWEMVYPTAREEHLMAQNRRVEIIISDCREVHPMSNDTILPQSFFYEFKEQDYSSEN
jgi:outer membrane protein OmpA-like peptidoglycan-associated protein